MGSRKPVVLGEKLKAVAEKVDSAAQSVKPAARNTSRKALQTISRASKGGASSTRAAAGKVGSFAQDLLEGASATLVTSLSQDINSLAQKLVDGSATIYDKAMDAAYVATNEGGSFHRLFDGGHTIAGAIHAGHEASAEDSVIREAAGILQGLLRDGSTIRGLPVVTWDKATFDQTAEFLESSVHIPKDWFYDLNTYDVSELLGGAAGVLALALQWKCAEAEDFGRLVGSTGLSSVITANPALAVVSVAALAKAYHSARQSGDYAGLIDGQFKGALGAGSVMATVSLVGVGGGPAGVALLAGLAAGVLANKATKNVSVTSISSTLVEQARTVAAGVLQSTAQTIDE